MSDTHNGQMQPAEVSARLHLANILMLGGQHVEALDHFTAVLGRDPANLEALRGATEASDALGRTAQAEGYRLLLGALSASPPDGAHQHSENQADDGDAPYSPLLTAKTGDPSPLLRERLRVVHPGELEDEAWVAEHPAVTLGDVVGMEAVKRRLQVAFLGPLRKPELRKMYGKSLRGGLLLYGPPGCGKTFIARALAGELRAKFIAVGLSDVLDMWLGESERKLHEIFETARRSAPAVLFFDEIDALGQKRSHLRHSAGRNVVNQLLAELDGVDRVNDGIFALGASNHPWDVDTALLRPGRFDRLTLVLPPDEPARRAILTLHLRERPADTVDVGWIASKAKEFSGADLAHLCESAAESAMEASVVSETPRPITNDDFRQALKEIRPSTRHWFEAARNYAMFANEGGMYDELLDYMRANKLL